MLLPLLWLLPLLLLLPPLRLVPLLLSLPSPDPLLLDVMLPTLLELSMLPRGRLTPTSMVDMVLDMPDMVAMLLDMALLPPLLWLLPLSLLATPRSPPLPP